MHDDNAHSIAPKPWYHQGLPFCCSQCGRCCTGSPGYTWVSPDEIKAIALFLGISEEDFSKKYLRRVGQRYSLLEDPQNYDCIFLEDKRCRIYSTRPKQCSSYPWWPENLNSPESWEAAKKYCEGINDDAPIVPFEKIQRDLEEFITNLKKGIIPC